MLPFFFSSAARSRPGSAGLALVLLLAGLGVSVSAWAERADRSKPLTIDADKSGTFDLGKQIVTYIGNVVVAQGTLSIRAERVELRRLTDGRRVALAFGVAGRPASFRQKREGLDETIEGSAERIEYDDRSDTVRFVGTAAVRRLRGAATADEISGALITYDNLNEVFNVLGTPAAVSQPDAPQGRVRAVFTPQEDKPGKPQPTPPSASAPR